MNNTQLQYAYSLENNFPFINQLYKTHLSQLEESITSYPIQIENIDQLSEEEFIKSRMNSFGASDSAVLLGVAYSSKNVSMKTIDELLQEKTTEVIDKEIGMKASVRKGKELEPLIIEKIQNNLNTIVIKPKHTYTNNKGLSTNFDGIIFEPKISKRGIVENLQAIPIEIKVCTIWARKNYDWLKAITEFNYDPKLGIPKKPDIEIVSENLQNYIKLHAEYYGIPPYYYTQLQQQMLFTNSDHSYLAVLDDMNWILNYFYVARDDRVIKELEKIAYTNYIILASIKGFKLKLDETDINI